MLINDAGICVPFDHKPDGDGDGVGFGTEVGFGVGVGRGVGAGVGVGTGVGVGGKIDLGVRVGVEIGVGVGLGMEGGFGVAVSTGTGTDGSTFSELPPPPPPPPAQAEMNQTSAAVTIIRESRKVASISVCYEPRVGGENFQRASLRHAQQALNGSHVQEYADDPRSETQSFVDPFDGKTVSASALSRTLDKSSIGFQLDTHYRLPCARTRNPHLLVRGVCQVPK